MVRVSSSMTHASCGPLTLLTRVKNRKMNSEMTTLPLELKILKLAQKGKVVFSQVRRIYENAIFSFFSLLSGRILLSY